MIPSPERPIFLLLIPVGIALVWFLTRQRGEIGFSTLTLLKGALGIPLGLLQKLLLCLVVVLAAIALAGPVEHIKTTTPVYEEVRDIVVVLDTSGSMGQKKPLEKISVAKEVIEDFITGRPQDRIGLFSFDTKAYLEWPLSLDHHAVIKSLSNTEAEGGTYLGVGFLAGLRHHLDFGRAKGAVIIVSDGISSLKTYEKEEISELVQETGVKVYWIWIGNDNEDLASQFGRYVEQLGGSVYLSTPEDLKAIFSEISRLETSPIILEQKISTIYRFGSLLVILAAISVVVGIVEFFKEV